MNQTENISTYFVGYMNFIPPKRSFIANHVPLLGGVQQTTLLGLLDSGKDSIIAQWRKFSWPIIHHVHSEGFESTILLMNAVYLTPVHNNIVGQCDFDYIFKSSGKIIWRVNATIDKCPWKVTVRVCESIHVTHRTKRNICTHARTDVPHQRWDIMLVLDMWRLQVVNEAIEFLSPKGIEAHFVFKSHPVLPPRMGEDKLARPSVIGFSLASDTSVDFKAQNMHLLSPILWSEVTRR